MSDDRDPVPFFVPALAELYGLVFKDREEIIPDVAERECDRLLLALREVRAEMEANGRSHAEEVQRADQWLQRVNRSPLEKERWLLHMLEAVAKHVPKFGAKKSRDLPHGVIGWRRSPERLAVDDADAVLAWAKEAGIVSGIKVTESVPHSFLVEVWNQTKKVPPGCRVVEEQDVFYYVLPEGGVG